MIPSIADKGRPRILGIVDVQIILAIGICVALSWVVPRFQVMTACITVLLCTQDQTKQCWKMGLTRLIVTAIGGALGIVVVWADVLIGQRWVFWALIMLGTLLTLLFCKMAKVPEVSARIGGVTFILVSLTLSGDARMMYAVYRLASTFGGILVVLGVSCLFGAGKEKPRN